MLTKEKVLSWFKDLPGSKRVDLMCSLFTMCVPFELHFFGTVIEGLNKKNSKEFHDTEAECNNTANPPNFQNIMDDLSRQKAVIQLALLRSNNRQCAGSLFQLLTQRQSVNAMLCWLSEIGGNVELSAGIVAELLLVYTLAANHPAFKFDEQTLFASILSEFMQFELCVNADPVAESFVPNLPAEPPFRNSNLPDEPYENDLLSPSAIPVKLVTTESGGEVHPKTSEPNHRRHKEPCDKKDIPGGKLSGAHHEAVPVPKVEPQSPSESVAKLTGLSSPAPPTPVSPHVRCLSLHRVVNRRGSEKRNDADVQVEWSDGKRSLVRLSSNDLQKFHRKIETLVTAHDALPTSESKHQPLPKFFCGGPRSTMGRVTLKNDTLTEYFEQLMKACPEKVLRSEEVANFLVRYSGRVQTHPQQESHRQVTSPQVAPEEESWEKPENFNEPPKKIDRNISSSSDEKAPVNTFVVFNSKLDSQNQQTQPQPSMTLPAVPPAIIRFGAHAVHAPRAHLPPHFPPAKAEDQPRLKSPLLSPDADHVGSQSSTPGLLLGSPLTSPPPPQVITNGNDSSASDDSVDSLSRSSGLSKVYLDKEKIKLLFSKEKYRKFLPKLGQYTLSELRDLPDEQYEKYGVSKSAVDKLRLMLCQMNISTPNGYYRPGSQNGVPVESNEITELGPSLKTPEPPAIVQMDPELPPVPEPILQPLEPEGMIMSPILTDGTPIQPFRTQLRPRSVAPNAIRPPPARFGPMQIFGTCPRPVVNSRPVPWPPVSLPPPQKPAEAAMRGSTSGSEVSSPPQSMGSSPAISPASTPGPNAPLDVDKERQNMVDSASVASSQFNGIPRQAARATPPMPVQNRLVGISPISMNTSPFPKTRNFVRRDSIPRTTPMQQKPVCYLYYPIPGVESATSNSVQYVLPNYPESQSYVPILNPPPFYHGFVPVPNIVPLVNSQNGYMPEMAYHVPPPAVPVQREPTPPEQTRTPPVISCYNCGLHGHRGQECGEATFDDIASQNRS